MNLGVQISLWDSDFNSFGYIPDIGSLDHRLPHIFSGENSILFSQFSSVAQSCPTLCNPMDCSTPGFPVHHQLPELTETHVHRVSNAIKPSQLLSSPSPTFNLSQHQGLFQWVSCSHQVAKLLAFLLQHQSFQWIFRTDFLYHWLVESSCSPRILKTALYMNIKSFSKHDFRSYLIASPWSKILKPS